MKKQSKILITVSILTGVILMFMQMPNNGLLQSSTLTLTLQSCKDGTNTSREVCIQPLQTEQKRLQSEIATLTSQINEKQKVCNKLKQQDKKVQEINCRKQLSNIQTQKTTKNNELQNIILKISRLVVTPRPLMCCDDSTAANYNATCGKTLNTVPVRGLCNYDFTLGCTDSNAINYDPANTKDNGSCVYPTLCMDFSAMNYLQSGPCIRPDIPEDRCSDPRATNYLQLGVCIFEEDPACNGPLEDGLDPVNRICMTCSDGVKNGDEEEIDCGGNTCEKCIAGCKDPSAINFSPAAKKVDNTLCIYGTEQSVISYTCPDEEASNYEANDGLDPNRIADEKVCDYCALTQSMKDIQNQEGTKVKERIEKMNQEQKNACKKEICNISSIEVSTCTVATAYRPQYGYLQMYLELAGESPGKLNGIYRSSKEITLTPDADDPTREAFVRYAGNTTKLNEIKNECPFIRELLGKELIKDYKTENTDRIKVTQMALTMKGLYSGSIDGDKTKTYNLLKEYYKWTDKKFGPVYIAGKSWQVARATRFGYNDPVDNGIGTPFMDPSGKGISTNNTSIQGASLPLPVTVKILCPNIVTEIGKYTASHPSAHELSLCQKMLDSSDPFNPTGTGEYSGLAVLSLCIEYANKAGYTTCRDKHHQARVKVSSMDKTITVPLVDIGPSESAWSNHKEATIDLTYGAIKALSGGDDMLYEACFDIVGS